MFGKDVAFALWLFWPAGVSTLLPVFAAHLPIMKNWDAPMDFGKYWRGKRLFGSHKTWRGFFAGWLGGSIWAVAQLTIYNHSHFVRSFCPADFPADKFLAAAILISLGGVIGDAIGSLLKRQFDVPAGQSWFPWDQLDFVFGGLILSIIVVRLKWYEYLIILATWLCIHLFFGLLGYLTKLKPAII